MMDAELDLHEKNIRTPEEVKYVVENFIDECYDLGYKKIRIITGRGLHSKNKSLLKPTTATILKLNKKVAGYRLDDSLGAFEISLLS